MQSTNPGSSRAFDARRPGRKPKTWGIPGWSKHDRSARTDAAIGPIHPATSGRDETGDGRPGAFHQRFLGFTDPCSVGLDPLPVRDDSPLLGWQRTGRAIAPGTFAPATRVFAASLAVPQRL